MSKNKKLQRKQHSIKVSCYQLYRTSSEGPLAYHSSHSSPSCPVFSAFLLSPYSLREFNPSKFQHSPLRRMARPATDTTLISAFSKPQLHTLENFIILDYLYMLDLFPQISYSLLWTGIFTRPDYIFHAFGPIFYQSSPFEYKLLFLDWSFPRS